MLARLNTLEKLYLCLRDMKPELTMDEELRLAAKKPIDRMLDVCGPMALAPALSHYDRFLAALDDPANRAALDVPPAEARALPLYRELKDEAAGFSRELMILIETRYPADHPLRLRLVL